MKIITKPDALAAFGIMQHLQRRPLGVADVKHLSIKLEPDLEEELASGAPRLHIDAKTIVHLDLPAAQVDQLADQWRNALGTKWESDPRGVRLQVEGEVTTEFTDLHAALADAHQVGSVVFAERGMRGRRAWHWPLHVGLVDDDSSVDFRASLRSYDHPQLLEVVDMKQRGECDLLMLESVDAATRQRDRNLGASLVLAFVTDPSQLNAAMEPRLKIKSLSRQ